PDKIAGARVYETLYRLIPHINVEVQTSTIATRGVQPNELAGVLTLFTPFAVTLAFSSVRWRGVAVICAFVVGAALVLTQSRSSIMAVAVACMVGAVLRRGRVGLLLGSGCLLLGLLGAWAFVGPTRLEQIVV